MNKQIKQWVKKTYFRGASVALPYLRAPVFVLGNQKSGTTAIAALMAECTGKSVILDLNRLHTEEATAAYADRSLTLRLIRQRCPKEFSHRIIKEPLLTFYASDICKDYPKSRIVFITRDPRDNIRSILNRLKIPGHLSELPEYDLRSMPIAWREVIENRQLGFASKHYIDALASRWVATTSQYQKIASCAVLCRYEDFVADKAGTIVRLCASTGLRPRKDIENAVDRQYQPRGDRDVSWIEFFGEENLQRIESICQSAMDSFGYRLWPRDNEAFSKPLRAEHQVSG